MCTHTHTHTHTHIHTQLLQVRLLEVLAARQAAERASMTRRREALMHRASQRVFGNSSSRSERRVVSYKPALAASLHTRGSHASGFHTTASLPGPSGQQAGCAVGGEEVLGPASHLPPRSCKERSTCVGSSDAQPCSQVSDQCVRTNGSLASPCLLTPTTSAQQFPPGQTRTHTPSSPAAQQRPSTATAATPLPTPSSKPPPRARTLQRGWSLPLLQQRLLSPPSSPLASATPFLQQQRQQQRQLSPSTAPQQQLPTTPPCSPSACALKAPLQLPSLPNEQLQTSPLPDPNEAGRPPQSSTHTGPIHLPAPVRSPGARSPAGNGPTSSRLFSHAPHSNTHPSNTLPAETDPSNMPPSDTPLSIMPPSKTQDSDLDSPVVQLLRQWHNVATGGAAGAAARPASQRSTLRLVQGVIELMEATVKDCQTVQVSVGWRLVGVGALLCGMICRVHSRTCRAWCAYVHLYTLIQMIQMMQMMQMKAGYGVPMLLAIG